MFTDFYAGSPVCSPARAVLLTGKSSSHVSIRGNAAFIRDSVWRQIALDKNEYTLGEMFKEAGYQSAFIGKWHLDTADQPETWAFSHGFDFAAQEQWGGSTDKYKNPGFWKKSLMKNLFFFSCLTELPILLKGQSEIHFGIQKRIGLKLNRHKLPK